MRAIVPVALSLALFGPGCASRQIPPPPVAPPPPPVAPPPPPPPPAPPPHLTVFNDGEYWVLLQDLRYEMANTGLAIVVPKGFVTDLASIPAAVRGLINDMGRHGRAAIVHDYLYWQRECTREQADQIMFIAMTESGVPGLTRDAIFKALREFGEPAWLTNGKERAQGLPREVPKPEALPSLVEWPAYRLALHSAGLRPAPVATLTPPYCDAAMRVKLSP